MASIKRFAALGVLLLAVAGLACYWYSLPAASPARTAAQLQKEAVSVFLPDAQGKLERKTIEAPERLSDRGRADIILRELKEARSIPDRLKLYDLALGEDGVLYLNVSKEFLDADSPAREIPMVYSMVDSFAASFPGVRSVQLLVEGEPVYTRSGLLYLLKPLQFNKELLED